MQGINVCNYVYFTLSQVTQGLLWTVIYTVHITFVGILNNFDVLNSPEKNCNILSVENSSSSTVLLLKLMSKPESVYMKTFLQIPALTSPRLTLTANKSMKMKFSTDKIHYNISQQIPNI